MSVPPLVYTAMSKHMFFCRDVVCEFVLREGGVPLNPFRLFDYFLGERVDRDVIRRANDRVLMGCDELWVFGAEIANGVLEEIRLARQWGYRVRFFTVDSLLQNIREIDMSQVSFEAELLAGVDGDEAYLRSQLLERG